MYSRVSGRQNRATQAEASEKTLQRRVARLEYDYTNLKSRDDAKAERTLAKLNQARRELAELYEA